MKVYKENDKSNSLCETCGLVTTTFKFRNVPLSNSNITVNILAGVCDSCDTVVSIPQQSALDVKDAIDQE